jgi:mono/diheme cytochrome c family protein
MTAHGLAALAWLLVAGTSFAVATDDDGDFARGRRLFERGIGRDGLSIKATSAGSATPIPGALLSCAGCHGWDGKGRAVSGLRSPDITWQSLTKPYSLRVSGGRNRPPYDAALVVRAVTTGHDSAGRALASAMPRFRLTPGDAADLLAYLRELGIRPDPGVGADTLTIGVLLPSRDVESAVRVTLESYREQLNRAGGIFGRRIEFSFLQSAAALAAHRSASTESTVAETVLALLLIDEAAAGDNIVLAAERQGLPTIAFRADADAPPARSVFYLSAGIAGELGALVAYAAHQLDPNRARLVVAYENGEDGVVMAGLRRRIQRAGWQTVEEVSVAVTAARDGLPEETLQRLACGDAVLMMTTALADARMPRCPKPDHHAPLLLLLPGSLVAPGWLPRDVATDIHAVVAVEPTVFANKDAANATFARDGGLRGSLPAVQESALAAARLLVEGLRRAGRDVTRPKLIDALESIQRFETDSLPPLNYGPRQHIGFTGAQIMGFDLLRGQLMEAVGRLQAD